MRDGGGAALRDGLGDAAGDRGNIYVPETSDADGGIHVLDIGCGPKRVCNIAISASGYVPWRASIQANCQHRSGHPCGGDRCDDVQFAATLSSAP